MNRKQAGIGLGVGVAAFVGLIALSGQYVPPTGPLQTIQSLIVKAGFTNQGALVESSIIRPTGVTGTLDNWAPTGIATASTVYATLSGDATLTSIAASQVDGRVLRLCASGGYTLTLDDAASSGTAANKLALAGGMDWLLTSGDNRCVTLRYDATATRWKADSTSMPKCSDGERLEYTNGTWRCRYLNDYRSTHLEWVHEFGSPVTGGGEYSVSATGTGATNVAVNGPGRPGVADFQTGTTSTGVARANHGAAPYSISALSSFTFQAVVGVPTLSTSSEEYTALVGCRDTPTAAVSTNGCYFLYDRGNVHTGGCNTGNADKWEAICSNNGTRTRVLLSGVSQDGACSAGSITTVDSPVAAATLPDTNMYNMEIVGTPTSVAFKINGTTRTTITTNIPSTVARGCGHSVTILKSAGNTSRSLYVDMMRAAIDLASARSPRRPTFKPGDRRHKSNVRPRHVSNDNAVPMRAAM